MRELLANFGMNVIRHTLALMAIFCIAVFGLTNGDRDATYHAPEPVKNAPAVLAEMFHCSDTVEDPTHVIVTIDGMPQHRGQHMTDKAIEQAMFGIDHGIEKVHAFCP